jgi:hypothetical protein
MTAPESGNSEASQREQQPTLRLVRDVVALPARSDESAVVDTAPVAPARRKIWPA